MNDTLNMTAEQIEERIDKLEHAIFFEQMKESYNSSLIRTYQAELKVLREEYQKLGGRWSY